MIRAYTARPYKKTILGQLWFMEPLAYAKHGAYVC